MLWKSLTEHQATLSVHLLEVNTYVRDMDLQNLGGDGSKAYLATPRDEVVPQEGMVLTLDICYTSSLSS